MIYGLYNSAAGMMTNEYRQAVLANNLANADTVGFKRDVTAFAERTPARLAGLRDGPSAPGLEGLSGGLWLGQTSTDFGEAAKVPTNNWSDVALEGPGFLSVQVNGQPQFTRDGRMIMDADGRLVAATDGAPILNSSGLPIQLNPHGGLPSIDQQGRIQQDGATVAELGVVDFENYDALSKVSATRFTAPENSAVPSPALVQGGYTESSGVQPISELVNMIEASRAYQINARMVSLQDETAGRLISTVMQA